MDSKVSEIENTIKKNIDEELKRSTAELKELMDKNTQEAVDRINGVYTSAINTLKQLELTDAGIFDFFQKTNGNIRVYESENRWAGQLEVRIGNGEYVPDRNPIRLNEKSKYKIIVLAIPVKEPEKQD